MPIPISLLRVVRLENLGERVRGELMSDYANALERGFDKAKHLLRVTPEGLVEVLDKETFTNEEAILVYLIGKLYAVEAELAEEAWVGTAELKEELGMPKGSVDYSLTELRKNNLTRSKKEGGKLYVRIRPNRIEEALENALAKVDIAGEG